VQQQIAHAHARFVASPARELRRCSSTAIIASVVSAMTFVSDAMS